MQSIASFAETLISGGQIGGQGAPNPEYIQAPSDERDISKVAITDDVRQSLIESSVTGEPADINIFGNPEPEVEDPEDITKEVRDLLVELKGILYEMTSTGALGVNMAGSADDQFEKASKKRGYVMPKKPTSKGDVGTKFYKAANKVRSRIRKKRKK